MNQDEKRSLLREYNHRINNDLQALLAFIKLKRRFGVDNDEILNFSCVSISSVSAIQNMMYDSDDDESRIGTRGFFESLKKILDDHYARSNVQFINETTEDFLMNPKKMFHIMFLVNEMVAMSVDEATQISFGIEKDGDDAIINYSCDASMAGCGENIFFEQMIKQIDASPEYGDSSVSIKFSI